MRLESKAIRWCAGPVLAAAVCVLAAILNVLAGEWFVGGLLLVLASMGLLSLRAQRFAYRAGYWRGSYEEMSNTRPAGAWDGWQPEPWDAMPPPP